MDAKPGEPGPQRVGRLVYRGGIALTSPDRRFGGWSGLAVSADGTVLRAISDKGFWLAARIVMADGQLAGLADARLGRLLDETGQRLEDKWNEDAEALAVGPGGEMVVAFERRHRLWRYGRWPEGLAGLPKALPAPPGIEEAPGNGGIETLAALGDGRLLAITEELEAPETGGKGLRGWLLDPANGKADAIAWTKTGEYAPTDAAPLPDGDVLVLERRFTLAGGPGMRLSRVAGAELRPGALLAGETLAELSARYSIDNMEGLAARTVDGRTLVYVLSDDNYNVLQRTVLLLFEIAR